MATRDFALMHKANESILNTLRFLNLSGKVAKKTTLTRKSGRHAHNCVSPLAIAAYEICHGVTEHG